MARFFASSALLLALVLGGCRCPWEGRSVWLATELSAGRTLEAKAGDEILLELPVEPGSKARWFVVEVDGKVLERRGPAEEQPGRATVRIAFRACRPGVTDVVAIRSTARSAPPERTFLTTIWVR